MQIQRIQTLYMFAAAIMMGVFAFMPMGHITVPVEEVRQLTSFEVLGVLFPVALTSLLLIVNMFLYNNLKLQRKVMRFSIMFTVLVAALVIYTFYSLPSDYEPSLSLWNLLILGALVAEILALKGINHDENLLKSADRLR